MKQGLRAKSIYLIIFYAKEIQKEFKISVRKWFEPRSDIYKNIQFWRR